MSLPKVDVPTYELKLPSTGEKIKYRPFLTKEEKVFLMALESEDTKQMIRSISDVINACTFGKVDVNSLANFDIEYIFLKLREVSVGEIVEVQILGSDEETYIPIEVDLRKIEINRNENHKKEIMLDDEVGVVMRYPTYDLVEKSQEFTSGVEMSEYIMKQSIEKIFDNNNVYEVKDFTEEEVDEFFEGLSRSHKAKIQEFFETMPKIKLAVTYNDVDGEVKEKVLEDLEAFFT